MASKRSAKRLKKLIESYRKEKKRKRIRAGNGASALNANHLMDVDPPPLQKNAVGYAVNSESDLKQFKELLRQRLSG